MAVPVWGRCKHVSALLVAIGSLSCAGANERCELPTADVPRGTLSVGEVHEFGHHKLISASYVLDDCVLQETKDAALLARRSVAFPAREVPAGEHLLRMHFVFFSAFRQEWNFYTKVPVKVTEGRGSSVTVRLFEEPRAEADHPIRALIMTN